VAGALDLVFVGAPHAHARLSKLDADGTRGVPGIAAILTAADLAGLVPKPIAVAPPGFAVAAGGSALGADFLPDRGVYLRNCGRLFVFTLIPIFW
jgi:CO/xanthine dehydrogenase Mo-binding subunit